MSLEEEFQESEKQRQKVEAKKNRAEMGKPSAEVEAVLQARGIADALMEQQASRRLHETINMAEFIQTATEKLAEFNSRMEKFEENGDEVAKEVAKLNRQVTVLTQMLEIDFEEERAVRRKQHEVLDKLVRYLDNWL